MAPEDKTWLGIDKQIVAFYVIDAQGDDDNYTITGRVPCELNGQAANLIIVFNNEHEYGCVAGATFDYVAGETDTIAKNLTEIEIGDTIQYLCDYYSYDQKFQSRYYLGEEVTVDHPMEEMYLENLPMGDNTALFTYKFTDIYDQEYWTPALKY